MIINYYIIIIILYDLIALYQWYIKEKDVFIGPRQQCQFWHHIHQLCLFATVYNSWKSENPRGIFRTLPNV